MNDDISRTVNNALRTATDNNVAYDVSGNTYGKVWMTNPIIRFVLEDVIVEIMRNE